MNGFDRRLAVLEAAVVVAGAATWQEAHAAHQRETARAIRHLCEAFGSVPLPDPLLAEESPALRMADKEVIRRWAIQVGAPEPGQADVDRVAELMGRLIRAGQLEERLDRFSVRPEASA